MAAMFADDSGIDTVTAALQSISETVVVIELGRFLFAAFCLFAMEALSFGSQSLTLAECFDLELQWVWVGDNDGGENIPLLTSA